VLDELDFSLLEQPYTANKPRASRPNAPVNLLMTRFLREKIPVFVQ
jgi:hypothetical protein